MQTALVVIVFLANAALVGAGIYLSAYLKKKAEGLATKEEFADLKKQTAELTRVTSQIETEIKGDLWNRQKQWELKRDVVFEMARKVGGEIDAISRLYSIYNTDKITEAKGLPGRPEKKIEVGAAWNDAAAEYEGMMIVVNASCGQELLMACLKFGQFMRTLSLEITGGKPEAFMESVKDMTAKSCDVAIAIRKELGIPKGSMAQSAESLAALNPAAPNPSTE